MLRKSLVVLVGALALAVAGGVLAQGAAGDGRLEGRLTRADGSPVSGATVTIEELKTAVQTDASGAYAFAAVPPGSYTLTFSHGGDAEQATGVAVAAGATATADRSVDWDVSFVDTITVFSASRHAERIVDAPAAITLVTAEEIERQASHGQVPKLLEFTPGVEVTQSGLYDFNFNTRGFNSSLNRRVATLVDGRDPSVPFLGAQEWAAVSFPLDDLASAELVRGPSAALYGANAASGVLNLTTKRPRESGGGLLRLTGGELSTVNGDARWAGALGGDWYLKAMGGVRYSDDFSLSRNGAAEYSRPCPVPQGAATDCLPQEPTPLAIVDDNQIEFAGLRIDKYFGEALLTFEGGRADVSGPIFQTGIGRVQVIDVERPWLRANASGVHWNLLAYHNTRDAQRQLALASGSNVALEDENWQLELQTNWDFADGDLRLVGGVSYGEESIDSTDRATGRQTLVFEGVDVESEAAFAQLDWTITPRVTLVVAGRFDDSTLHDSQVSPKASLLFAINPNNVLRLTYNEAFQVPNYSEFFLQANVALPVDLRGLNQVVCVNNGVNCGLGITRVLALGNEDLELEEVKTWELGYSAVLGGRGFLTVDYFNSENENFITDLVPQLGTGFGRVNPNFGPWQAPAGVPAALAAIIRAQVPLLTNNLDGSNIIGAVSYTNFGQVDTQGIELGLHYYLSDTWNASFSYSWFDFDIKDSQPGLDRLLLPNTPEHKFSAGLGYVADRWDAGGSVRWVDTFRWVVGPFQGDVDSYATVDLNGNYRFNDHFAIGLNIANALEDEHWESFGGDLLGRRALGSLTFTW